jgi:hypothetical protein
VADYELWGLVVSHNEITSVADIYHDRSSVDTKDLCVVWGENLSRDDYRAVEFESGPFTCYFRFAEGVPFDTTGASNNHLITDRPEVRRAIAQVRIGDQVHLRGLLVDYQMDDWEDFWRHEPVREDSGCEVIYTERWKCCCGTPGWYSRHRRRSDWRRAAACWVSSRRGCRGTGSVGGLSD